MFSKFLAQVSRPWGEGIRGLGPLGLEGVTNLEGGTAGERFTGILSKTLGFLTLVGGLWFLISFITAGYNFISAHGDANKIKEAQQKIMNSIIGLAIIVSAVFILSLIGWMFHLDFLDIFNLIDKVLSP